MVICQILHSYCRFSWRIVICYEIVCIFISGVRGNARDVAGATHTTVSKYATEGISRK